MSTASLNTNTEWVNSRALRRDHEVSSYLTHRRTNSLNNRPLQNMFLSFNSGIRKICRALWTVMTLNRGNSTGRKMKRPTSSPRHRHRLCWVRERTLPSLPLQLQSISNRSTQDTAKYLHHLFAFPWQSYQWPLLAHICNQKCNYISWK